VTVSNIAEVQAADEGKTFTIRGIVTSNASGYDKNTAFFDCIYVQDTTAGINAFPVAGNIQAGQTVEIIGKTSSYNGERQIAVAKVTVIDETIKPLPMPISLTTAEAASGSKLGSLVKVEGTVASIETSNNVVESIYIKDSSNMQCRVFIDGYITSDKAIANLAVGAKLTATGLSSIDTVGTRIRIRNRADIICTSADTGSDNGGSDNGGSGNGNNNNNPDLIKENPIANNSQQHVLSESVVKDLIAQVKKAEGKNPVIEINIDKIADKKDIEVVLSKASINEIATATEAKVKINTGLGSITFSEEAIKKINQQADDEKISIGIALIDDKKLSSEAQEVIGDRPVYEFSVTAGSKEVTSFGKAGVQVSLPYVLKEGEDVNSILVYYIDDSGNHQITRSNYNQVTKNVDFVTSHFSTYAIGYNQKTFGDVKKSDSYYDAVSYITARGISTGTAEKTFSPDMSLTRGQFIVLIMNAYNIKPDENSTTNFADAGHTYYTQYLAAAKRLGITNGIGNNLFAPNRVISRQDMVALLYNVLKQVNELPQTETHKNLNDFKDFALVSSYAKDSMKVLVEGGFISDNNGMLNPKGAATRADMTQILYNLLIIK
ncbi:MAG: Ig domain protein, partial [Pelosinus sp.]|nr:Ig domain protein [Pelosinus sp.]